MLIYIEHRFEHSSFGTRYVRLHIYCVHVAIFRKREGEAPYSFRRVFEAEIVAEGLFIKRHFHCHPLSVQSEVFASKARYTRHDQLVGGLLLIS